MKHVVFAKSQADTLDRAASPSMSLRFAGADEPALTGGADSQGRDLDPATLARYVDTVSCFAPDCLVACESGQVAVTDLKAGDMVLTRDNGLQPIRAILHRNYGWRALGLVPLLRPVEIRAGALGRGLPVSDITLSPNHRIAADPRQDAPVMARSLVGQPGIRRGTFHNVTYIQLQFDRVEMINVGGVWCETCKAEAELSPAVAAAPESAALAVQ